MEPDGRPNPSGFFSDAWIVKGGTAAETFLHPMAS
jgi:hypothetical protein